MSSKAKRAAARQAQISKRRRRGRARGATTQQGVTADEEGTTPGPSQAGASSGPERASAVERSNGRTADQPAPTRQPQPSEQRQSRSAGAGRMVRNMEAQRLTPYVLAEVRRIGVLAAAMLVLLAILTIVLR